MVSDFGATHPYPFQMLVPPPPPRDSRLALHAPIYRNFYLCVAVENKINSNISMSSDLCLWKSVRQRIFPCTAAETIVRTKLPSSVTDWKTSEYKKEKEAPWFFWSNTKPSKATTVNRHDSIASVYIPSGFGETALGFFSAYLFWKAVEQF